MHLGWASPLTGFISSVRTAPPILEGTELFTKWEAAGHFWLPDRPEEKLWGNLSFAPGHMINVVLEGNFWKSRHGREGIKCAALNGVLFNGAHCTIFDSICYVESYFSDKEYQRSTLQSPLMLLGAHFSILDEVRLRSISVGFSHLDRWFQEPYSIHYKRGGLEKALVSFSPDTFEIEANFESEAFTISPFCQRKLPSAFSSRGKVEFTSQYVLVAKSENDQQISRFLSLVSSLRSYLMLLIGCGVYTLELVGVLANQQEPESGETLPDRVRIYLPVNVPLVVQTDVQSFVSGYEQVSADFATATKGWFEKRETLSTVTRAYSEVLQNDGASEESVFLLIVQTLEHLHGIIFPSKSKYVSRSAWKKFRDWLAENVPDPFPGLESEGDSENKSTVDQRQLRTVVLDRINSLNKLSFRSRLGMLFREIPQGILMPIFDNPYPRVDEVLEEFLRQVEETRNYLTHYDKKLAESALKGKDLEKATARCWAVLTYWIATYIGFGPENSRRMALNAKRAMFLVAYKTQL
jgi:hypothetical protein